MPRIDRAGILAGVAAQVSLDTVTIHGRGTCASWLQPNVPIANVYLGEPDRWELQVYVDAGWHPFGLASNQLAAGGGLWLGWRSDMGVYDGVGSRWPEGGLAGPDLVVGRGAAAPDGTLGVILDRQSGTGVRLLRPDGSLVAVPDASAGTLAIGSAGLAVWVEGGQVRAWGRPHPAPQGEPAHHARPVQFGADWLLLVTTNDRVWLRRWDVALGAVVVPGPTGFNADAMAVDAETVHVCWSLTSGEAPADIRDAFVPVSSLTQPVNAAPVPPEPTPEPPDPEPPDPEPEPPTPDPGPPPLFAPATLFEVSMEAVPCVLRMGSFYAQIQASQAGKGPFGWYPVAFTTDRHDAACAFTRSSPDGERLLLRHDGTQAALGADATEFIAGGNVCAQLYGKPNVSDAEWGGYEAWWGWELDQERRIVLVEYDREDGLSTSLCLTVEDR